MIKDFKNYAIKHLGVTEYDFNIWDNLQNRVYGASASMTPYVLEERELRAVQVDIYSRMMMDRKIWIVGPIHDWMSNILQAQLLYLDSNSNDDITIHIDTPGGCTKSGKSIIDVMRIIKSDVSTINTGMAASMGSLLLAAGTKGKRFALPFSKVMIHQVSAGTVGNIQDMRITLEQVEEENESLFRILGETCNKDWKEVLKDAERDKWFSAQEAIDYGIVDEIVKSKK